MRPPLHLLDLILRRLLTWIFGSLTTLAAVAAIAAERMEVTPPEAVYRVQITAPELVRGWEVQPAGQATVTATGDRTAVLIAAAGSYRIAAETPDGAGWLVTVALGQPSPTPPPTPQPIPQPSPQPTPVAATPPLTGVVVEAESRSGIPPQRLLILTSKALPEWFAAQGYQTKGVPNWRIVHQDVIGPDGKSPPELSTALAASAGKPLPWLIVTDAKNRVVSSVALPSTVDATLTLLRSIR